MAGVFFFRVLQDILTDIFIHILVIFIVAVAILFICWFVGWFINPIIKNMTPKKNFGIFLGLLYFYYVVFFMLIVLYYRCFGNITKTSKPFILIKNVANSYLSPANRCWLKINLCIICNYLLIPVVFILYFK